MKEETGVDYFSLDMIKKPGKKGFAVILLGRVGKD